MILVTGSTGTVGRPLINTLLAEGADVRALTRDRSSAGLPDSVEVVEGDPSSPGTVADSLDGLEWTSLRVGSFAVNTIGMWAQQIQAGDVVRYVYAGFAESFIHERDMAAVAARALLDDDLVGRRLVLTGPESLTHAEAVAVIGDVLDRQLRFDEITPPQASDRMLGHGFPEPFVTALMARYAKYATTPQLPPTGEVEEVLGRPALSYARWVADHATAFQS